MKYAEIKNNQIQQIYSNLPATYNNISNFFALEKENLRDLGWSGNEGVKFYEYIENIPELPQGHKLVGPTYTINDENGTVIGDYTTEAQEETTPEVPETITATQIRLWLVTNNISLSAVDSAISAIEDALNREKIKVQWEYAPYIERNHPFINALGEQLGLSSIQIDTAFIEASQL
jgi:hypothetical protein